MILKGFFKLIKKCRQQNHAKLNYLVDCMPSALHAIVVVLPIFGCKMHLLKDLLNVGFFIFEEMNPWFIFPKFYVFFFFSH